MCWMFFEVQNETGYNGREHFRGAAPHEAGKLSLVVDMLSGIKMIGMDRRERDAIHFINLSTAFMD